MIKNKKGFTLIELVVGITILGICSMVVYSLFKYSTSSYLIGSRYTVQQDKLVDVIQKVRVRVEEAKSVKYDSDNKVLILSDDNLTDSELLDESRISISDKVEGWKFEDQSLKVKYKLSSEYKSLVDGLDVSDADSKSSFEIDASKRLIIKVKPIELNNYGSNTNRNVTEPLVTEISVRYKN
jgi:prepilin-type N-terminal cleavage/methylation domain-containing protein